MASVNPTGYPQPRAYAPGIPTQPPQVATGPPPGPLPQQMSSPNKDVNTAQLCRVGQEFVQDIVQKTAEIFQLLKAIQLPNGVNLSIQTYQDRKLKLEEHIRQLMVNFKKLRVIYDKVQEDTATLQQEPIETMLPIEEDGEVGGDQPRQSDTYKYTMEEHRDVVEQLELRNKQLKEIIDHLRNIIWEINTMMAMRRT